MWYHVRVTGAFRLTKGSRKKSGFLSLISSARCNHLQSLSATATGSLLEASAERFSGQMSEMGVLDPETSCSAELKAVYDSPMRIVQIQQAGSLGRAFSILAWTAEHDCS